MYNRFIGYVYAETNGGILFGDHFWAEPDWFPKSQCIVHENDDDESMEVTFDVKEWLCGKKNLEETTLWEETSWKPISNETS